MKLKMQWLAAAAALVASSTSFAVVQPGEDLGVLTKFPVQFGATGSGDTGSTGDALTPTDGATFLHFYFFTLSTAAEVIGSVDGFFGAPAFSSVAIAPALGGTPTTQTFGDVSKASFSFDGLAAGDYVLTLTGFFPAGNHAYSGSVYAAAVVPEPESLALVLAGLAVAGVAASRRRT